MNPRIRLVCLSTLVLALSVTSAQASESSRSVDDFGSFEWTEVNTAAAWEARAGLQVVELNKRFYLMGGRTPIDPQIIPVPGASVIWSDVWQSQDKGASWQLILATEGVDHWVPRAYFEAVTMGPFMYVLGGQDFNIIDNPDPNGPPQIPFSQFFNDVWRSQDGVNWTQLTDAAGWEGRAGLTAVVHDGSIFVLGGSYNDDEAIGPNGPERIYFNDVWRSDNGSDWVQQNGDAPWDARAGARAVSLGDYIYLVGGEAGFICQPIPCEPPYFNDVWRSSDGVDWELVTAEAPWEARPGHVVVVYNNQMVLFGGFGLSDDPMDPFAAANPMDVWVSQDGASWKQVSDSPWNAVSPEEIKYDFDALVTSPDQPYWRQSIYTFGGDRETFDFTDLENYLNVDNDVWSFALPGRGRDRDIHRADRTAGGTRNGFALSVSPNPFNPSTTISFSVPLAERVELAIYDVAGRRLKTLIDTELPAGNHSVQWDGRDESGRGLASGVYLSLLRVGETVQTDRLVLSK